jgi:hypothetical protein
LSISAVTVVAALAFSPSTCGGVMPRRVIRCSTLFSCWSVGDLLADLEAGGLELLADLRGPAGALHAQGQLAAHRRRAPTPGSISHQAPEAISIADRASTVGPITGIRFPST